MNLNSEKDKNSIIKANQSEQYNQEFLFLIKEINQRLNDFEKGIRIRINKWVMKFAEVCGNLEWEKNRNLHAILLLDSMINNDFEHPYDKLPKDEHLPIISKSLVKAKISKQFLEYVGLKNNDSNSYNIQNNASLNQEDNVKEDISKSNFENPQLLKFNNSIENKIDIYNNDNIKSNINVDPDLEHYNFHESIIKKIDDTNSINKANSRIANFRNNFYENSKHLPSNKYNNNDYNRLEPNEYHSIINKLSSELKVRIKI